MAFLTVTVQVCEWTAASSFYLHDVRRAVYIDVCVLPQLDNRITSEKVTSLIDSSLTPVHVLLAETLWPLIKHLLQWMFNFLLNRWLFQFNDTSWDFIIHKQSSSTYSWDNITVLPYFTEICVFLLLLAFGDQMYNIKNWLKNIPSQAWRFSFVRRSKPVC